MDTPQAIALFLAGIILPLVHERLFGNLVEGANAIWVNFVACFAIAALATLVTGGFAAAPNDPWLFSAFLLGKASGIFAIAQLVFQSANDTVQKVGGTAPTPTSTPTAVPPAA